ncbi:hypothetical protein N496_20035 (plasmid) [Clostridium botulinum A2B3 87]|uniref:hypothetical protein n=1 Tax=Clostridium botulinum TaxID=1491 RepID=UPI0004A56791|nr:hypothetical protein [Clostridium botulinum]KEI94424.1 hypothetical protein N496_20035 [Clostridium botulinum A2B3 87]MBN3421766.1 hypothetical protein [Clostridium botulinum]MBY6846728.1 hypothetical protein [Clostridium botulinum]NEZ80396.1 hypothetical protein [Clostridium botulinum]NFA17708.1 hypothetical protein [Clostridium botulinum]
MEKNKIKVLTGTAIINRAEGKRIAFTYSEIDEETGDIIEDNKKQSFIALNDEFLNTINQIEDYIKETKLKE